MPEENYQDEDEEQESFAYADYTGVVIMIQTYYYKTLELFRRYYFLMLRGRDDITLKKQIQSYILTVVQLLRNYTPIQQKKKLHKIFDDINKFAGTLELMSYEKMKECIDSMIDSHYVLGLSKLEFKKYKKTDKIDDYKKDL